MKKTFFAKAISFILILAMLAGTAAVPASAESYTISDTRFSNGYIEYLVDKDDGRFIIRTEEGSPSRDTDSDKKLLFDKNNDPETSFTSFIIDGEEYIFGNDYGFLYKKGQFLQRPVNTGSINTSIWEVDNVQITQKIELIEDLDHPNVGNVKIRYEIKNNSNATKEIGSRILLDTMLGENDGAAVVLGNTNETITKESEVVGENIPTYWRCSDDLFAPKVISYGFTKGWGNPAPDKMLIAHWSNISETKWNYSIDSNLDFTSDNNNLGTKDSAVALYWNEKPLKSGELSVIETYYGLGDLSNYESNSPYSGKLYSPDKLTVNSSKDGYNEETVQVTLEIDNTLSDSENLTNVKAKLITKTDGFIFPQGEEQEKTIPIINKGEIVTVTWNITPVNQDIYVSEPIKAEITSDNNVDPVTDISYTLMPSIQGEPPEIQILSTAPEKIYYQGDKYISIKGNGFNYFNDKNLWNMYLIHETGKRYEIKKDNIDVSGDTTINITILDGDIEEDMEIGKYTISIEHSDFENSINTPSDKRIEFTDDEAYKSRNYGVLYVEKRKKDGDYYYYINTVSSKEKLDELKKYLRKNKKAPNGYETTTETSAKGELVDIIFDIVGDVTMTVDQTTGLDVYRINTNQNTAIINSVIKYKDAKKPIEIKKVDDLIVLKGNGTLQVINYGEVWWFGFETYISDKQNYCIDEVVEEEEEDDEDDDDEDEDEEKDEYLGDEDELEIEPEIDEEEKVNLEISLFDPLSIIAASASLFIDGFELELKNIILLDEGASLGGKLAVEIPIGKKEDKKDSGNTGDSGTSTDPKDLSEDEMEKEIGDAMHMMFMTEEERREEDLERYKKAVETENAQQLARIEKEKKDKILKNSKLRAAIINDDEIGEDIIKLFKDDVPTSTKVETAIKLIPKSKNLILKVINIINNKDDEDDDSDKSVGIAIDVKKVMFGKKYGEDHIYNDIKFIGVDGTGKVNIELPGLNVDNKQKEQGISAELTVNTIEGIYSLDADVNIKIVEAHAFITIMRFKEDEDEVDSDYKYLLDDLVLSGGYVPGIPVAPPVFISEVGGGVEDLYGVIRDDKDAPPMKVVIILGLNVVPSFQGDFTLKVSKNGFSLDGALSIKDLQFIKQAHVEIQWARPIYFALAAKIEAFEMIEGEVSLYIGEIETGDDSDPYKFYFEGKAKAKISIPKKVPLAGGITLAGVDLGVSTIKLWGKLKIGFIPLGITWIYDEGVKFGQTIDGQPEYQYVSLTNVTLPEKSWRSYDCQDNNANMKMVIGSNISVLGTSKYEYASISDINLNPYIVASLDRKIHQFNFQDVEIGLIELTFEDEVPNLTVKNPNGDIYPLISMDDDFENGNYRVQIIPADESESGNEEKLVYIAINNPMNGTWSVESNQEIESTLMDVTVPPGFNSINMVKLNNDKLKITWDAHHTEDSLVSLFILKQDDPDSAGYPLASNLDGGSGAEGVEVSIPIGLQEGNYIVRGTIQHPQYGYETLLTDNSIRVIDYDKPANVENLKAELYGNGLIKASWEPIEEEGSISYFATVYDNDGNTVDGFVDFEVSENSIVLGGEYKNGNNEIKLQTEREYTIGITARKILNHDDGTQTLHIGEEVLSNSLLLRKPRVPEINITYIDNPIITMFKTYFNSNTVEMKFETEQNNVNTRVYLDGEYFTDFDNSTYNLFFELEDGEHKVKFISENQYKDRSEKTISFCIDTTSPELLVDTPLPGFVSKSGQVEIKGTAENGSSIIINGEEVALNNDTFVYEYTLSPNRLKEKVEIVARDTAGNETKYSTEVTNGKIDFIKDIYLRPNIDEIISGSSYNFSVVGIDNKSNEIAIDPSNVQWSLIEGDAIADISDDGVLTANEAGDIVLKASYYISENYSYDDAIEIKILDNIEFVYLWPYVSSIQIGDTVNFGLYEATKYDENFVDNAKVNWEITKGNEYATIDEFGCFKALKKGQVTLKGSYIDKFGNTQQITSDINITKETVKNNYDIDGAISKIWINLIQTEKNIVIENIVNISGGSQRKFSVRGIAEIEVPFNTVRGRDEMFVGTVNYPDALIDSSKYKLYSDIIELQLKEAEGKLNNPIKVTFKYRGSDDINPENLGVYYYNPKFNKWQYIGGKVNKENGTIEVELDHLSKYTVLEKDENLSFVDISGRWSSKYIDSISSLDIVNGETYNGQKYFKPARNLTRLEFAAIVIRTFEKMYDEISPAMTFDEHTTFSDYASVPQWGKEYIRKVYEYGLIKGVEKDGQLHFLPNKNITRAEVFTILGRIIEINSGLNVPANTFKDKDAIPSWAMSYVDLLQYRDLLSGYSDGTVKTYNNISREEIAKICYEWIVYRDMELKKH